MGTVHQEPPDSGKYVGYDIEPDKVLHWLKQAADLGSVSAQSVFSQIKRAIGQNSDIAVSLEMEILWLKNATLFGSHKASQLLKTLSPESWQKTNAIFKTEYCGIGKRLMGDDGLRYRDMPLEFFQETSLSERLGSSLESPLHLAASTGREDVVQQLCLGASRQELDYTNKRGETALFQAARCVHTKVVKLLLELGANAGIANQNGENVLHWLCSFAEDEKELAKICLAMFDAGAEIEKRCTANTLVNRCFANFATGGSPLHRAVQRDAFVAAKVLVKIGASPYNDENGSPMGVACSLHQAMFIDLLLSMNVEPRLPAWHGKILPFDVEHSFEVLRAKWNDAPTFQTAAPNAWKSMTERGNEPSLLGYAVHPRLLHERMATHGSEYLDQMHLTLQILATLDWQSFERVTVDYQTAILRSVKSRDISIVSYLLDSFPDRTVPLLTFAAPTGESAQLPIQLALILGQRPIFKVLLNHAGPETPIGTGKELITV